MDAPPNVPDSARVRMSTLPTHDRPSNRLPWLLLLLLGVIVLAFLPALFERIEYSRTRGEVRAIREGLPEFNFKSLTKAFSLAYRQVRPSVVHVETRRQLTQRENDLAAAMFGDRAAALSQQTDGSGAIVDAGGYVVTNNHVVEGASEVMVALADGRSFAAELVGADPAIDLAVLKINAPGLIALPWGDSNKLDVGEMVWAIGNPYGLDQTVTSGIVSAKGRRGFGGNLYQEFLQTDVAVNPGSSGGPLVNVDGEMVGINTAIVGRAYQGITFAIPSNLARDVYEQIRTTGKVVRGYLGVGLAPITPEIAAKLQLPADRASGALISGVAAGSPAERAGLEAGDVIVKWDGQPVTDYKELTLMVARATAGSKVPVVVIRDGKEVTLEVTIAERPVDLR